MSSADPISREVAWRVFASEYDDATLSFKEGDDDRAPNYVVTPTGAKINRLFVVGVLTETENVGNDGDMYRARISDPTGTFVSYAGQYQQEAMSFFAEAEPPMFVALVGKARTYEPEDGDAIYTSVRPEEVNGVDGATRDRWNVQTARQTLARIDAVSSYFRGTVETDGANALLARLHDLDATAEHYDLDAAYLTDLRRQCLEVLADMAGEEVEESAATVDLTVDPAAAEADEPDGTEPATGRGESGSDRSAATAGSSGDGDEGDGFDAEDFSDVSQEPVDDAGDGSTGGATGEDAGAADDTTDASDDAAGTDVEAAGASDDAAGMEADADTGSAEAPSTEPGGAPERGDDASTDAAAPADDGTPADDTGATGGRAAGDAAADVDEEGEWEWDEGEREELEEEFGAEFESASEFDPDEATVSEGDEDGQRTDGAAAGGEGAVGETAAGGDEAHGEATETDDASAEPPSEGEDDAAERTADAEPDEAPEATADDPDEVVLGVLEDAAPEGLTHDEVVAAATDEGLSSDDAEEALDDLLMDGLCYESGDVVKPL